MSVQAVYNNSRPLSMAQQSHSVHDRIESKTDRSEAFKQASPISEPLVIILCVFHHSMCHQVYAIYYSYVYLFLSVHLRFLLCCQKVGVIFILEAQQCSESCSLNPKWSAEVVNGCLQAVRVACGTVGCASSRAGLYV